MEVALRLLPFDHVLDKASRQVTRNTRVAREYPPEAIRRAIHLAYRVLPFESTCLTQALIFCFMYNRRGLPAELHIGVQKAGNRLAAHAWVEDGNGSVLTDPLEHFATLPLPTSSTK